MVYRTALYYNINIYKCQNIINMNNIFSITFHLSVRVIILLIYMYITCEC